MRRKNNITMLSTEEPLFIVITYCENDSFTIMIYYVMDNLFFLHSAISNLPQSHSVIHNVVCNISF